LIISFIIKIDRKKVKNNDPEKIADAKSTLLSAVAGLVLVLLSIAILRLLDVQLSPWGIQFLVY